MHAEQGITAQFSPQRAKNQPNPAWDYILFLTIPCFFPHVLPLGSVSLSLSDCLVLLTSLHHLAPCLPLPTFSSFLPYILTLDFWALFVFLLPPLLCLAPRRQLRSRERKMCSGCVLRETTQTFGRLIRNLLWQGSVVRSTVVYKLCEMRDTF